jgi:hypothetical protein
MTANSICCDTHHSMLITVTMQPLLVDQQDRCFPMESNSNSCCLMYHVIKLMRSWSVKSSVCQQRYWNTNICEDSSCWWQKFTHMHRYNCRTAIWCGRPYKEAKWLQPTSQNSLPASPWLHARTHLLQARATSTVLVQKYPTSLDRI